MNHGLIERVEHHIGGGRYHNRAFLRLWVVNRGRRCWLDIAATNYLLKPGRRVVWREGLVYYERSPLHRLLAFELLAQGKPEPQ